ncbi:MAG TPA: hypothetical protein PLZ45_14590 [Ferruginibacter sp.]|nr:hypothetical protein [Chitinophagaceae bacterium]HRI25903.1 hypothetical protein [Ferruginibacter sp.]
MDLKKLFMGGIVASILFFVLGWLIYGMLLMDFMKNHTGAAGNVMLQEPNMLYLVIGNLASGFMMAYIFVRANVNTAANGFITAAVIGLLVSIGFDCITYATTTIISKTAMAADVAASTVMSGIIGAITAMVMGMGKKAA